jgi:oxygen-dependent protoporphyrinogen oxidase
VLTQSVAIIGGGITGLTAAFYLKRAGVPVILYEAGPRVGGVIQSLRRDGYLAEFGPNTLLETSPKIAQLVQDAGLQSRRLEPDPAATARYLVRYQRPIPMPATQLGFLTSELFSLKAKLSLIQEPFRPARRDGVEESIAQFVQRRLGQEFLDQAVDPLAAGIYAGDPYKLSLQQAFPRLAALEEKYGSMIKGQFMGARERKKTGEVARDRAPKFSFDEGLQVLTDTLGNYLGDSLRLNMPVTQLTQSSEGWTLDLQGKEGVSQAHHHTVIYAGTAYRLAEMKIIAPVPVDCSELSQIRYPPVASVVLGFRHEDVTHSCQGFGMLIPKVEGFNILGTIFSSSLFPNRAPAGHLTLTCYVGGERQPELAGLPPEKLFSLVTNDLRRLLGVKGNPTFAHSVYWPRAIPQYNVGYGRYRALMTEMEQKAPGLLLAGSYRDGISLSDSIVSGSNVAEKVINTLKSA